MRPVSALGLRCAALAAALLAAWPVAAEAKAGDTAWAQCAWRTAPQSADSWLRMAKPTWTDNMATPAELLGHRLIAICSTDAANERKPNRTPNWSALRAALTRARPSAIGASDAGEPSTLLCRNHIVADGREILFRMDVVRVVGTQRTTIFQQHFGEHEGRLFRVPQDIRHLPAADARLSVVCRSITSRGELADA